jgi:predicted RNA-binding Zn-ribbon protein involved in translation (DUF1610 family)
MISLRMRLYASWAVWVIGGYLLSALLEGGWLIFAEIALAFGVTWYSVSLHCPNCGDTVVWNIETTWLPWLPDQCRRCGYLLD